MASIFNYTTLKVNLSSNFRSLQVTLNRPENLNAFNLEMSFELESLLTWVASHIEIETLIFRSEQGLFSCGIDAVELQQIGENKSYKLFERLNKITQSIRCLPQTTIIDLGEGASNIALEFSLAFDLRFGKKELNLAFDHLKYGLLPQLGGITLMKEMISENYIKKWLFTGLPLTSKDIETTALISDLYDDNNRKEVIELYLKQLATLAPVQKIQLKNALQHLDIDYQNKNREMEKKNLVASKMTGDFNESLNAIIEERKPDFMSAKAFSTAIKIATQPNMDHMEYNN